MPTGSNIVTFPSRTAAPRLRRPRILIRAAREGQARWRRERDLPRLLRCDSCPGPGRALARLRSEEEVLNTARLSSKADYDLKRHILVMIAILAEMRAVAADAVGTQAGPQRRMAAAITD